jgi:hypothetical protein
MVKYRDFFSILVIKVLKREYINFINTNEFDGLIRSNIAGITSKL